MIYLIEKLWIDPSENRIAHGYDAIGYATSVDAAEEICSLARVYTEADCWSLKYTGPLRGLRYRPFPEIAGSELAALKLSMGGRG